MTKLGTFCSAIAVLALSGAAAPTATFARGTNVAQSRGQTIVTSQGATSVQSLNRRAVVGDESPKESNGNALDWSGPGDKQTLHGSSAIWFERGPASINPHPLPPGGFQSKLSGASN